MNRAITDIGEEAVSILTMMKKVLTFISVLAICLHVECDRGKTYKTRRVRFEYIKDNLVPCLGLCQCDVVMKLVDCSYANMHKMPPQFPCDTKILLLDGNGIETVDERSLRCLTELTELYLNNNKISNLSENAFMNLHNLAVLDLSSNVISAVHPDTFLPMNDALVELNLNKNIWSAVPSQDVFKFPMRKLEILRLQENGIRTIHSSMFSGLTYLKILDLETNVIGSLTPGSLFGLNNLEELYLGENFFSRIPGQQVLQWFQNTLKVLSFFNHFKVNRIPPLNLTNLEIFDVASCSIVEMQNENFNAMPRLITLRLSYNALQSVPPEAFSGLYSLQYLYLNFNNLITFPHWALSKVTSLRYLNLDYNPLITIPALPSNFNTSHVLRNLTHLTMDYNACSNIDEKSIFVHLTALRNLSISYTQLQIVPPVLSEIPQLEELTFDGNNFLSSNEINFPRMPQLKILRIRDYSDLETIGTMAFSKLNQLREIYITGNQKLANVSANSFDDLPLIHTIDMSRNKIQRGYVEWAADKKLFKYMLEENNIMCDCGMTSYQDWILSEQYNAINTTGAITCNSPRFLQGRSLQTLDSALLTCDVSDCPNECLCSDENGKLSTESSSITTVDCSYGQLINIPGALPLKAEHLRLNSNFITQISNGSLKHLNNLTTLQLSNNRINSIQVNAFENLHSLKESHLQNNQLSKIDPKWFLNTTKLTVLRLDSNYIVELEESNFRNLALLTILDISRNALTFLHENAFAGLFSLERLVIETNRIIEINKQTFTHIPMLKHLFMAENEVTTIEKDSFANLHFLQSIDLTKNKITSLTTNFIFSPSITKLDMESNLIEAIDDHCFRGLPKLETAFLAGNLISVIGNNSFQTNESSRLTTIDLGYNLIQTIPMKALSPLSNLETLKLNNNPIATIRIEEYPTSLSYLPVLKTLYLAYTDINNITEGSFLQLVPTLEMLVINNCRLTTIPETILDDLPNLDRLILDGNPIAIVNAATFPPHLNITTISLRFATHLNTIGQNAFSLLPKLKSLQFSGGGISEVDSLAFAGLNNIEMLDLSNNRLTFPDRSWFASFDPATLKSVSLWGNYWSCSCSTLDYKQWLEQGAGGLSVYSLSIQCYEPIYLKGTALEEVPNNYLCYGTDSSTTSSAQTAKQILTHMKLLMFSISLMLMFC